MTRSTKKTKAVSDLGASVELTDDLVAKLGTYKLEMIPSDAKADTMVFELQGIPCVGFVNNESKTIQFLPHIYMDMLMQHYISCMEKMMGKAN